MSDFLSNPFMQSSVVPFLIAIVIGLVTSRWAPTWTGLSVMIAFLASAYLIAGFQLSPLTSTRKILLIGVFSLAVGIVLDRVPPGKRIINILLVVFSAITVLWIMWPLLARAQGQVIWWQALAAIAYTAWCLLWFHRDSKRSIPLVSGILVLAAGSGIAATVAATALLGQLVSTIAAACGALWLLLLLREFRPGMQLSLPAVILSSLFGIAAVFYARLPWSSLAWLALVPVLSSLPAMGKIRLQQAVYYILLSLLPAIVAVYLAWKTAGDIPF